jgi:hypothetical protein
MAFLRKTPKNRPQNDRKTHIFISYSHDFISQISKKAVFLSKISFFKPQNRQKKKCTKEKCRFYVVKHIKQYVNF